MPTASPQLQEISDRAYLYAYGVDEACKHLHKTLVEPDYPANRFQLIRHLADDNHTAHVTINNDTLHLMGWLDVAAEPVIVSVPDDDNADSTVTLSLGSNTAGKAEDTNFLPVPREPFYFILRMYGGDSKIQAGRFPVPVVRKV